MEKILNRCAFVASVLAIILAIAMVVVTLTSGSMDPDDFFAPCIRLLAVFFLTILCLRANPDGRLFKPSVLLLIGESLSLLDNLAETSTSNTAAQLIFVVIAIAGFVLKIIGFLKMFSIFGSKSSAGWASLSVLVVPIFLFAVDAVLTPGDAGITALNIVTNCSIAATYVWFFLSVANNLAKRNKNTIQNEN